MDVKDFDYDLPEELIAQDPLEDRSSSRLMVLDKKTCLLYTSVAANYNIKDRVYVAVIDMPSIMDETTFDRKYEGIAKFPAATRDISMVVPKEILAGDIEKVFDSKGGAYLESYTLFDIYEGAQIKPGYKSIAYSCLLYTSGRKCFAFFYVKNSQSVFLVVYL